MSPDRSHMSGREAGVSLIEVLVGVSILGIVAFAISLTLQPPSAPLDHETDRLALRLNQAAEEAIATGSPVGLAVEDDGQVYAFYRYVDRQWWVMRDHPSLAAHRLDGEVRLDVPDGFLPQDTDAAGIPAIWFDPAGLTEPFRLRLDTAQGWTELDWTGQGGLQRTEGGAS
ncbi:GspH/FimT family pseudopilin [Maricaulis parjimensis]|uniref:GspH/FimT family pseudopilin n=1 Tax=Maricaulis parjimensis TaxID=144023 RepID=UPI00193A295A|nr:GspH/FimT family pseudopilin [Maricaulis parjimensis]